ncbi:T9SS type A sorting domain-containing protein [Lacinutrix cladophorae]
MKQNYLFTLLLFLFSIYTVKSQIAATYEGINAGSLSGVPFTFTNTTTSIFETNLDGSGFSAAPISGTTETFDVPGNDNWTVTFNQPISNLRLYCRWFRNTLFEFDQPFTILSSDGNLTNPTGNQLNSTFWANGIIEFTNPITTLSLTYISGNTDAVAFTFGLPQTLSTDIELSSITNVRLFPNPSTDFIQISGLKENEEYTIYNILGEKIKNGTISESDKIDIRDFTTGLYFLKLRKKSIIKFLKE